MFYIIALMRRLLCFAYLWPAVFLSEEIVHKKASTQISSTWPRATFSDQNAEYFELKNGAVVCAGRDGGCLPWRASLMFPQQIHQEPLWRATPISPYRVSYNQLLSYIRTRKKSKCTNFLISPKPQESLFIHGNFAKL